MTAPSLLVEIGFGSTWQTEPASITWTDVTDYVLHKHRISTSRGASSARGQVDVGSLNLSLRNADRRFDPLHASGPYFGDLKPGVPIRVRAVDSLDWDGDPLTWDGEELVWGGVAGVWYGSVAKWPQRYDLGNTFGWVPVEAWDGFDKLSRAKIPRSVLEKEILADSPVTYWALDERSGVDMLDRSGSRVDGTYTTGTTSLGSTIDFDSGFSLPAIAFDAEHEGRTFDTSRNPSAAPATLETLFVWDGETHGANNVFIVPIRQGGGNPNQGFAMNLGSDTFSSTYNRSLLGRFRFLGTDFVKTPEDTIEYGTPYHMIVQVSGSTQTLYLNGTAYTATVGGASASDAYMGTSVGQGANEPSQRDFEGKIAFVVIYAAVLSEARRDSHYAAATAPLDGQRTDERITFVLDELGWPANLRDLEVGNTSLGHATFKPGDGALEYLRVVNASEDGLLFTAADGTFRFLDRYWRYLNTLAATSQFTFTDQDGDQGYAEFQLDLDDDLLVNIARFTRRDGTEQVASDPTSVTAYGEAEKQQTNLLHRTDAETLALAQWTVVTQSEPLPRIPKIRIPLHRYSAADQETILGLDLGHRVTCLRTPQGVGAEIDLDFLIDGIRHDVGGGEWWTDLYVSPVPTDTVNLFILDTSELDGPDVLAY
jgi:hypothetical protein